MADEPQDPDDLLSPAEAALTTFLPPASLPTAVEQALTELQKAVDLFAVQDEDILRADQVALHRINYITALLRIGHFLRSEARTSLPFPDKNGQPIWIPDTKMMGEQAKVGIAFLRHAETAARDMLKMGRTTADGKLADAVKQLKADLSKISESRARVMARKADKDTANGT